VAPVLARRIWSILRNLRRRAFAAVIAKSNVLPIANFTDGIFKQASAIATGWLSRP
jgi:hypothetical protein